MRGYVCYQLVISSLGPCLYLVTFHYDRGLVCTTTNLARLHSSDDSRIDKGFGPFGRVLDE